MAGLGRSKSLNPGLPGIVQGIMRSLLKQETLEIISFLATLYFIVCLTFASYGAKKIKKIW